MKRLTDMTVSVRRSHRIVVSNQLKVFNNSRYSSAINMKFTNFIQLSVVVLCIASSAKSEDTLFDAFNDIYATCLVNLNTDCIQPKALEWFSRVMQKREIHITDDLSIVKNASAATSQPEQPAEESARDSRINLISQVDEFLSTHYLHIRYPKSIITENVPSFMVSTVDRLIPGSMHIPLEEGNPNEGIFKNSNETHYF